MSTPRLSAVLCTLCALTLPLIATAQSWLPPPQAIFPQNTVYRQVTQTNAVVPLKQHIPGVGSNQHGSYQRHPYYVFIDDARTGEKWLISDGPLKVALTLIPGSAGSRPQSDGSTKVFLTAKYRGKITRSEYRTADIKDLLISINDPVCGDQACFRVSGTGEYPALPSGDDQFTIYVPDAPTPNDTSPAKLPWGSTFSNKPGTPLYYMYVCWDITKLAYADYQPATCQKQLLSLPGPNSRNYRAVTGHMSLPWGWLYDSNDYGSGNSYSRMMTTSKDVSNGLQRTTGYNVTGKLNVNVLDIVDTSTSFTFKRNDSTSKQFSSMYENKTVFTENQYYQTEYAIVVDKINGGLNPDFMAAVDSMVPQWRNGTLTDSILTDFIKEWGTHYPYAVTYGTQGTATITMDESQVEKLIAQGVNLSEAWSADASVTVLGDGGEVGGGSDNAKDKEQQSKFSNIVSTSKENYHCSGGASCDGGKPSGTPLVPVYLDLRPISELLAPPYYKGSAKADIMLGLRDKVQMAILDYAFHKSLKTGPTMQFVEITFDDPLCNGIPCSSKATFGSHTFSFSISLDPALAFDARNADTLVSSNMSTQDYRLTFDTGQPTILLNPSQTPSVEVTMRGLEGPNKFPLPGAPNDFVKRIPLLSDGSRQVTFSAELQGERTDATITIQATIAPKDISVLLGMPQH